MGLLTNVKQRNKLVKLIQQHNVKLAVLLFVCGVARFFSLAYEPFNAGTYFSENALLPGLVESELPRKFDVNTYRDLVKAELNKDETKTPQKWIFQQFEELGLEVYRQNFSLRYPFQSISKKSVQGENVYAILRARRAASTEAIVFSVPLRPLANKIKAKTGGGIALALALAKQFKRKPYWAKDIVFLFSEYDEVGALAWLDAYHQAKSEYIVTEELEGRSGPIQGAINVEIPLEKVSYYCIKMEGLNGQLTNLDLVNLVVKLGMKEGARISIHESKVERRPSLMEPNRESLAEYKIALKSMLRMMWHQASGAPSGNHGLFHKFNIEALTLKGVRGKGDQRSHDLATTARIMEGIFRSLNNLLERFHQSFFFYLLPGVRRYVSIGMYMPAFGLMVAASLIKGIALWVSCFHETDSTEKEKEDDKQEKEDEKQEKEDEKQEKEDEKQEKEEDKEEKTEEQDEKEEKNDEEENEKEEEDVDNEGEEAVDDELDAPATRGLFTIIPIICVSLLLGWLAYQGPELLIRIMPRFRIHTEDMILYSLLAIFTAALMYPKMMTRKSNNPTKLVFDWQLLKSVALITQALVLSSISLVNISQAFFLTLFMVPVSVFVRPTSNRFCRLIQMLALILVSPLTLMFYIGLVSAWPETSTSTLSLLTDAFTHMKELIFLGVMDSYLFNAWTAATMTAVIFPMWLLFWVLPWADV